ncbi:craniofacial development protein 1 [Phalaenopsis equestris]|uniref:craniofacial development protein 1 n=1 Tax=Phalaenopsis equestris TaxID=78828 RepID=UPI0009E18E5A|nr:craniofacial development protein 1 [Phalaenopsis equestris]
MARNTTCVVSIGKLGEISDGPVQAVEQRPNLKEELEESEIKARVDAAWNQMNRGLPVKMPKTLMSRSTPERKATLKTPDWMVALGLVPKKTSAIQENLGKKPAAVRSCTSEESRMAAAAALSAVREVTSASASTGKVEIKEVRDFAGQDIEVKKLVDANSREAVEKAKSGGAPPSALDTILDQIKKKQKLSVLDKTKKDWGEYKEEHRGLEDELDAYKKSSNQYLDKVSFLQRADLREFERERDARLAMQAKRKLADMREDNF